MTTRSWASWRTWGRGILLVVLAGVFIFPLLWMLSYSLRPLGAPPPTRLDLFAPPLVFSNYARLFEVVPLARYSLNSLLVLVAATPFALLSGSWAGFALSQAPRPIRWPLLALSVALLLAPGAALWPSRFILFARLGWVDSLLPLIAPALMGNGPFYMLLFYVSFARIPRDVYDSALLDGVGPLRMWASVALPLARPALVAATLLTMADTWSNYADALLYIRAEASYTLPLGIRLLQQLKPTDWPLLMAASVLMVAPVFILFLISQHLFHRHPDIRPDAIYRISTLRRP